MEPRMVERSNLDDLYSESLNPGLSKANSKPGQKKVPFCLIQLGLGFLLLATKRFPSDTSGEQGRPSLRPYGIHCQMGEAGAEQRLQV